MRNASMQSVIIAIVAFLATTVLSFVPIQNQIPTWNDIRNNQLQSNSVGVVKVVQNVPTSVFDRQRRSVANIQLMGLFGLGAPEIAVILVAAAFLLGPQKLAELGKDAGKIAGELKEVPKEFQAGLKEGEQTAQVAKQQQAIPDATIEEKKE